MKRHKRPNDAMFTALKQGLEDAIAFQRGENCGLRVTELPPPPKRLSKDDVRRIRQSLGISQVMFARVINVSPNSIRSWEQGTRKPTAAALKLLTVAKEHPEALFKKRA
jgi:putative transcriptional regulator